MTIKVNRENCVSCGAELPKDIVFIGEQYPSAVFLSDNISAPKDLKASSLNLTRCSNEKCSLIQLSHRYNLQYVFDHYPYESGTTATMKQILQDVIDDAQQYCPLEADDVVLDIGGNDGTLLGLIDKPVRARVNIDAAAGVAQTVSAPDYHHIHAHFNAQKYQQLDLPSPKLITSVAMFYHLSDPLTFVKNILEIMDDKTVWVLQMTYVGTMLRDNILDNIVHEHVAYYSLFSLEALLSSVGLHIAEARIVESYGGSLRVFIVKNKSAFPSDKWRKDYSLIENFEIEHRTNSFEELYAFDSRVQLLRETLRGMVAHLSTRHEPLWAFGASTKGNMILQFIETDVNQIPFILDNSTKKIGSKTTGTLIPIVEESSYIKKLPDYMLILPYYYKEAFFKIIQKALPAGKTIELLIPLPYPHFITIESDKI
jgi:NDP-4-keto-2,6-dideoxyhexose 3-C-methyltransferase